jgi:NitT/TauT family transport system ATP-binding protein
MVFQDAVLLPWRSVLANVLLPIEAQKLGRGDYRERAVELLNMVGLGDFMAKYPHELSGGMQQRTAIARALVTDPEFLFMDEPFGALDALTREQLNVELLRIWGQSNKTVVFVTHSISESVFLADRVVVMSARPGRIVHVQPVVLDRPRDLDLMVTAEFGELVTTIRRRLDVQGGLD